jgi:hypothetical protein
VRDMLFQYEAMYKNLPIHPIWFVPMHRVSYFGNA